LDAARPALRALAADTRETVTLEVLVGEEVLVLDEATGGHVVAAVRSLGERWPAHATSTGKVLLASLSDAELDARLRRRFASYTPRTITDGAALRRELERVRASGYATAVEELELGFVAVGVPVRSASGEVVAAISVGGPKGRFPPATVAAIAQRLPAAVDVVSARLGWRAPKRTHARGTNGRAARTRAR
jgi:DNA-binding IclR family transcriptional regulator